MENYIVSARKYRPSSFDSVVGQQALTTTLKNAIKSGKLAHAYLFCGPRGVGKTTCARIFAKTINCMNLTPEGDACNECESCRSFNEQRSYNIHELDAASNNSVEEIKQLMEQVRIPPQIGQYKVFIIDEVHMLTTSAFNAFLKTLEEPPKHAIFILATTEKHKILPTILSRCQIYDFNRMGVEEIVNHLQFVASKEGVIVETEALNIIAQKADGGMRDALSIFDQVASYTQGNITYKGVIEDLNVLDYDYYFQLTDLFLQNAVSEVLLTFDEILRKGFDAPHFINGLSNHLRNLLVSQDSITLKLLEVSTNVRQRYQLQATQCPPRFLYRAMKLCSDCDLNYRPSNNKRFLIELTLIQLAQLTTPETENEEGSGRGPAQLKPISSSASVAKNQINAPISQNQNSQHPNNITPPNSPIKLSESAENTSISQKDLVHTNPVQIVTTNKKVPHITKGSLGLSIKKLQQEVEQKSTPSGSSQPTNSQNTQPATPQSNTTITDTDLSIQWRGFAHTLPQEQKALQQRMLSMSLTLLSPQGIFEVLADNPMTMADLQQIKPLVEHHLRTQLKSNAIQMQIRVRDTEEQREIALTQGERFKKMLERNQALKELREKFGLELH